MKRRTQGHIKGNHGTSARRASCALCEFGRNVTGSHVRCKLRPRVDIDSESGRCPLDRWPDSPASRTEQEDAETSDEGSETRSKDLSRFFDDCELKTLESRRRICASCDSNRGLTALTVKCRSCGCAGISLIRGRCYLNKWPDDGNNGGQPKTQRTDHARPAAHPGRQPIVLRNHQSPGDIVVLTAAVRDLAKAYGDKFDIQIDTSCNAIWENNPYVTVVDSTADYLPGSKVIKCEYPGIHKSNERPHHFIQAFVEDLERKLGVSIPITAFKGDIHLSDEEKSWTCQVHEDEFGHDGPFWIIVAGGKYDFTAKWWNPDYAQQVVDHFKGKITFVQCGEVGHWHPPLKGVINLIGKTDLRQFLRLMYHADGVVCPVTLAMHAATAVPTKDGSLRPCVVIAGGREPVHWEQYPGHQFLHTIGALDCCRTGGCWKSRCQTVGDGDLKDRRDVCERPVEVHEKLSIPKCMELITSHRAIEAVELWFAEDHLSFPRLGGRGELVEVAGAGRARGGSVRG